MRLVHDHDHRGEVPQPSEAGVVAVRHEAEPGLVRAAEPIAVHFCIGCFQQGQVRDPSGIPSLHYLGKGFP